MKVNKKYQMRQILLVITLMVATFIIYDRGSIIYQSNWQPATITGCEGKWVNVKNGSGKYRDQLQFIPKATAKSGVIVKGSVMLPTRAICNLTVGSDVSVLLHPTNANENRIHSFIQFWALPAFVLSFLTIFLAASSSRTAGKVVTFTIFLAFSYTIINEFGLLQRWAPIFGLNSNLTPSAASLERCIYTSMSKEAVSRNNIKKLICMEEKITDLSSISDLHKLEELYLQDNSLTSLEDIPDFPNLKKLSVAGNENLTSTKGIEKFTTLQEFQANKSGLKNLSGIEQLSDLRVVGLMMNNLNSVSEFKNLNHLEWVVLNYNPITDISAFENKKFLTRLDAHSTKIVDITPLLGNSNLEIVGVSSQNFSCTQLSVLRNSLPETTKIYGPSRCH